MRVVSWILEKGIDQGIGKIVTKSALRSWRMKQVIGFRNYKNIDDFGKSLFTITMKAEVRSKD